MQQFARVQQGDAVIPGLVSDAGLLDLRSLVSDITPATIASGVLTNVNAALLKPLAGQVRYLAPISAIRQIPATGFNYKKHIEEMKVPTPTELEVFLKSMLSLTGPFDPISRGPNRDVKLDWETELAIVIGREVQDITAEDAADYIFGYVCLNDVSDRSTQVDTQKQQHLVRAKSRPTYCPIGPYLSTGINPMDLDLWTKLNGRLEQQGNTSNMLFSVHQILAHFSRHMRMVPDDVVATGTPPGVRHGQESLLSGWRHLGVRHCSTYGALICADSLHLQTKVHQECTKKKSMA